MSRLCVKNLPAYLDDRRLREHFGEVGEVTDARVIRRKDGNSRRFGYVGFLEEGAAKQAIKHFNKTFIDTCRIQVEEAFSRAEAEGAARPWSKYSKGSSRWEKKHGKASKEEDAAEAGPNATPYPNPKPKPGGDADDDDAALKAEFLQVAAKRRKDKFWANDAEMDAGLIASGAASAAAAAAINGDGSDSDDEYADMVTEAKPTEEDGDDDGAEAQAKAKGAAKDDDDDDDDPTVR
mmetsp:Transcript_8954/g.26009  ORF Transcript_8954/g.26009 Transcript_8954/m.26009 type:complete len:236 (-) Transcript_8954:48-755(-)